MSEDKDGAPMTDEDIRAAVERERKAHVEMQRIVGVGDWWGRRESPQISIPADMERDSDLVIARSLSDVPALAAECLRRGEEVARLRAANENNLAGWSNDRAGLSEKVARLEAEVAALRKERDEDRKELQFRRVAVKTWMGAADEAESRLSALAAAAREYQEASREERAMYGLPGDGARALRADNAAYALDALLSGEEGR